MFTKTRLSAITLTMLLIVAATAQADSPPGDYNSDGILDAGDLPGLDACFAGPDAAIGGTCTVFDLDGDGDADMADFAKLAPLWQAMDCAATATASSVEGGSAGYDALLAVDGNLTSRWASEWDDNQWLQIDFGRPRNFDGMTIHWEAAYATEYAVLVSNDAHTWSQLYSTTTGDGGTDTITFAPQSAQYMLIECMSRATEWGFSIWEVEINSDDFCYETPIGDDERIEQLIAAMTLEEKTTLVYGATYMDLHAIARLGIPSLKLADGPLGIRRDQATAFPAPIALASSWDVDLMRQAGVAYGREWVNKGRQVLLGPCIGLVRVPQGGRNFETYGEDPYFNGRMAVAMVQGVQSQNVVACIKHYACNNQEYDRFNVDIQVDERTLRELYLPVFKAAVQEGGAWAVMAAYNRVNGPYCTASSYLQNIILKQQWGFEGFVVSDWGAVHDTVGPANAGMDLEMDSASPVGAYWGNGQLHQAVLDGHVSEQTIDDKVRRILRAMTFTGILDQTWPVPDVEMIEHRPLVRQLGAAGAVLLKNDGGVLPLDKNASQTIAIIGPNASVARLGGGGSSEVTPFYSVSPREGIANAVGANTTLVTAIGSVLPNDPPPAVASAQLTTPDGTQNGVLAEYFNNTTLAGTPYVMRVDQNIDFDWGEGSPAPGMNADGFSVRWTGALTVSQSGTYTLSTYSDDGVRVWLNDTPMIDNWTDHGATLDERSVYLNAGQPYELRMEYYENGGGAVARLSCFNAAAARADAIAAAASADAALVFVGLSKALESEGYDRASMDLDADQVSLINGVAAANPNTVVVVVAGSQVGMADWVDNVPAIVQAWYLGQEEGNAIADVLFGDVNPSAKLPMTFIRNWEDHPAHSNYPGNVYGEGLFLGYRHFDQPTAAAPLFPFGHGLSYTTFAFSNLVVDTSTLAADGRVTVSVDVTNTGVRDGAEVVQVYVHDVAASVERPYKELKGFAKVSVAAGQTETVQIELDRQAFAYYDVTNAKWTVEPGGFEILAGASAGDIRLSQTITYPGD